MSLRRKLKPNFSKGFPLGLNGIKASVRGRQLIILGGAWCNRKKNGSEGCRKKKISVAKIRTIPPPDD